MLQIVETTRIYLCETTREEGNKTVLVNAVNVGVADRQ